MGQSDRNSKDARQRPQPRKRTSRSTQPAARVARSTSSRSATPVKAQAGRRSSGKTRPKTTVRVAGSGRPSQTAGRKPRKPPTRWRKFRRIALIVLGLFTIIAIIVGGIAYGRLTDDLPDLSQPPAPLAETSIIYDRDDNVLVELYAEQNRTYAALANIPLPVRQGVIATEDQRFYEHEGVDPLGIARALWVDVTQGKRHGGSTITQQYVVNTFVKRENTVTRKIKEAILAYRLEKNYTKDEILEKYLNTIYFGHGAYGVQAAAQTYFGKDLGDLTVAESAMIAGVIKSPGDYSPRNDPDTAKKRRDTVLGQMLELGYVDQATHDAAVAEPFTLAEPKPVNIKAPYFVEWVKQTLIDEYGPDAVFKGGLRVKTTIDVDAQSAAEKAITTILDREDDPSASIVAIDPRTGEVLAMVGGKDFNTQQFNVAVQGHRQPGSSFKPFVLVTALEKGISPEQTYESGPARLSIPGGQIWKVTGASGGPMRLRVATEKSVNSVFAQLILAVGADKTVETAQKLGIESEIQAVPAIALGGLDKGVSPLEMASAYGTLANGGVHMPAHGITEVTDVTGEVLFTAEIAGTEAVSPAVAYLATDMLKGVIARGTGTAAKIGRPAAGKTGTTQKYRDAWFVGYTPEMVTAVWVGYPEGQKEMLSVHGRKVTGGSFPAQIWAAFMKKALAGTKATDFKRPPGLTTEKICLESGQEAGEFCTKTASALFLAGKGPVPCELHAGPTIVDLPNLIGMMKDDAIALLNSLKLGYTIEEKPLDGVPAGMVGQQSPAYPAQVPTSTIIALIVSTGDPKAEPPVALFDYAPKNPRPGDQITFDASASTAGGTILKYAWEFGDGTPLGAGKTVKHTFTAPGNYTVTLWVTDDNDEVASLPVTVEVK
jgi:penicillin-binding protein 1A